MKRLSIFLPLMLLTLLQGCFGGGGSAVSTTNTVRLVNGTINNLDMATGGSILASNVPYGGASGNATITSGTYTIEVQNAGTGLPTAQTNLTFTALVPYTLLAYTTGPYNSSGQGIPHIAPFIDTEPAPAPGVGEIRVADLAPDAGNLDVYISTDNTPAALTNTAAPFASNISGTTGYFQMPQNIYYHIWVTGAGAPSDLRLDYPKVYIGSQQSLTLALTGTTGGVLVDGLVIPQQGIPYAPQKNPNARIRIAASTSLTTATATVAATTTTTAVTANLLGGVSPFTNALGTYILVPAGSTAFALNSGAISCSPITTTHGEDLTLLVTAAATPCTTLVDDNTRPNSGYAKIRLVNGVNGSNYLSLNFNTVQIAANVALGSASIPTLNNGIEMSGSNFSLDVTNLPTTYSKTGVTLQSQGVYSLFMLGTSTAPIGILNPDH